MKKSEKKRIHERIGQLLDLLQYEVRRLHGIETDEDDEEIERISKMREKDEKRFN